MLDTFSEIAGATGLAASAGLNAYLPLLVVSLLARFTGLVRLNEPWNFLTSGWAIGLLAVLLLVEMAADKIPGIDTLNDGIQTVWRPLAGAILFAAGSGMAGELHPVVASGAGLLVAGGVHAAKTLARPGITLLTGGTGNWVVSILEDLLSLVLAVMAILVPLLVLLPVAAVLLFFARCLMVRSGTS